MHHGLLQVFSARLDVRLGSQSDEAALVEEDPQRVTSCHQDVEAQIELETIEQKGLVEVALRHKGRGEVDRHLLNVTHQEDAFALATIVRLDDESLVLRVGKLELEVGQVRRQDPCVWEELVFLRKLLPHAQQISAQVVLARNRAHANEVVHFLVRLQLHEAVSSDGRVAPQQVEVVGNRRCLLPVLETATNSWEDFILALQPKADLGRSLRSLLATTFAGTSAAGSCLGSRVLGLQLTFCRLRGRAQSSRATADGRVPAAAYGTWDELWQV
mmetsp:Transcript_149762/g.480957  ORF Transcript_149762/g.480957 Transcript_149762/m.480957 type:complete len:272 (+) Transcript_149762:1204-2019(+)